MPINLNYSQYSNVFSVYRRGVDINEQISENCPLWPGYTPLQLSIVLEFVDVARILLCRGADINIVSPNGLMSLTTLRISRSYFHPWTVNPEDKKSGGSCLHFACKYGLADVVEDLIHRGADVNMQIGPRNNTPLHVTKSASVVKVLIKYGANLVARDKRGSTPLHCAFHKHNHEAIEAMLECHGQYQANPVDNLFGISHLHIACRWGNKAAVKGILAHSVKDINEVTTKCEIKSMFYCGYTPLHCAVKSGSVEVVQLLLDHGALQKINDKYRYFYDDQTPLQLAISLRDDTSITQVLLDAGAELTIDREYKVSLLRVAVKYHRVNHVELLLKHGAEPIVNLGGLWAPIIPLTNSDMRRIKWNGE